MRKDLKKLVLKILELSQDVKRPENYIINSIFKPLWPTTRRDRQVKSLIADLEKIFQKNLEKVEEVVEIIKPFKFLWEAEPERATEPKEINKKTIREALRWTEMNFTLGHSKEKIKLMFRTIDKIREEMSAGLPGCVELSLVRVDCSDLKTQLENILETLKLQLSDLVSQNLFQEVQRIVEKFDQSQEALDEKFESAERLVELEAFLEDLRKVAFPRLVRIFHQSVDWLRELFPFLSDVTEDRLKDFAEGHQRIKNIESFLAKYHTLLSQQRELIESRLEQKMMNFRSRLEQAEESLAEIRRENHDYLYNEMIIRIQRLKGTIDVFKEEAEDMEREERILEKRAQKQKVLEAFEKELEIYSDLWEMVALWMETEKLKENVSLLDQDMTQVEDRVFRMQVIGTRLLQEMGGREKECVTQLTMIQKIQNKIRIFWEQAEVLKFLCNRNLEFRHWEAINEVLSLGDRDFTPDQHLGFNAALNWNDLRDLELEKDFDALKQISEDANKEAEIKIALKEIKLFWQSKADLRKMMGRGDLSEDWRISLQKAEEHVKKVIRSKRRRLSKHTHSNKNNRANPTDNLSEQKSTLQSNRIQQDSPKHKNSQNHSKLSKDDSQTIMASHSQTSEHPSKENPFKIGLIEVEEKIKKDRLTVQRISLFKEAEIFVEETELVCITLDRAEIFANKIRRLRTFLPDLDKLSKLVIINKEFALEVKKLNEIRERLASILESATTFGIEILVESKDNKFIFNNFERDLAKIHCQFWGFAEQLKESHPRLYWLDNWDLFEAVELLEQFKHGKVLAAQPYLSQHNSQITPPESDSSKTTDPDKQSALSASRSSVSIPNSRSQMETHSQIDQDPLHAQKLQKRESFENVVENASKILNSQIKNDCFEIRFSKILKKIFPGIELIVIEHEKYIKSVRSVKGEEIQFNRSIDLHNSLPKICTLIQKQLKKELRAQIYNGLGEYSKLDRTEFIKRKIFQVMFIIEIVIWTFETENALSTEGLGGIKDYLFHMNQSIISLHSRIGKIDQKKWIFAVLTSISLRDRLERLIEQGVEDCNNFAFQRLMRYYIQIFESNNTTVERKSLESNSKIFKNLDSKEHQKIDSKENLSYMENSLKLRGLRTDFEYAYEYLGDSIDPFICPQTEKAHVSLFNNLPIHLSSWKPCFLGSNQIIGAGKILQQFSLFFGRATLKITQPHKPQYRFERNKLHYQELMGAAFSETWAWAEIQPEQLKDLCEDLEFISESFNNMLFNKMSLKDNIHKSKINKHFVVFLNFQNGNHLSQQMPDNLKNRFRVVNFPGVDGLEIIRAHLETRAITPLDPKIDTLISKGFQKLNDPIQRQKANQFLVRTDKLLNEVKATGTLKFELEMFRIKAEKLFKTFFTDSNTNSLPKSLFGISKSQSQVHINLESDNRELSVEEVVYKENFGRLPDLEFLAKFRQLESFLLNQQRVIVTGDINTGKSFSVQLLHIKWSQIFRFMFENRKRLDIDPEIQEIVNSADGWESPVMTHHLFIAEEQDPDSTPKFSGNVKINRIKQVWDNLIKNDSYKSNRLRSTLLKWLVIEGDLGPSSQLWLERKASSAPQAPFSLEGQSLPHNRNTSNLQSGLGIVLEQRNPDHLSPGVLFSYPRVHFERNEFTAIALATRGCSTPQEKWVGRLTKQFFRSIFLPLIKGFTSTSQRFSKRTLKKHKTGYSHRHKKNPNLSSSNSKDRILNQSEVCSLLKHSFPEVNLTAWGLWVNLTNAFQSFYHQLRELLLNVERTNPHSQSIISDQPLSSHPLASDDFPLSEHYVHSNLIEILLAFSLTLQADPSLKFFQILEKNLKKFCKRHFSEMTKIRKDNLRELRRRSKRTPISLTTQCVPYPEHNLMLVYPHLFLTPQHNLSIRFAKLDEFSISLESQASSRHFNDKSSKHTDGQNRMLRSFASNLSFSVRNSRLKSNLPATSNYPNDTIKETIKLNKSDHLSTKQPVLFLENKHTRRALAILQGLNQHQFITILSGAHRSGKNQILKKFMENKGNHLRIMADRNFNGSSFRSKIMNLWRLSDQPTLQIVIEDLAVETQKVSGWREVKALLDNVQRSLFKARSSDPSNKLTQLMTNHFPTEWNVDQSEKKNFAQYEQLWEFLNNSQFALWGVVSNDLRPEIKDLAGKMVMVSCGSFEDKEIFRIFDTVFMNRLGMLGSISGLREKVMKGNSVIIECFSDNQLNPIGLTQGLNVIHRTVDTFRSQLLENKTNKFSRVGSFLEQELLVKILVFELLQNLNNLTDSKSILSTRPSSSLFWNFRNNIISKRLKIAFRKKMSINLDLVLGRYEKGPLQKIEPVEQFEQLWSAKIENKLVFKKGFQDLKKHFSHLTGMEIRFLNFQDDFVLRRVIELQYRVSHSQIVIFRGLVNNARENLHLVRLLENTNCFQVYDSEQVFKNKLHSGKLIPPHLFISDRFDKHFEELDELSGVDDVVDSRGEFGGNSLYSNDSSSLKNQNTDHSKFKQTRLKDFMLKMTREILVEGKHITVILNIKDLDPPTQKILTLMLENGDEILNEPGAEDLTEQIKKSLLQRHQGQLNKFSLELFKQKVQSTLSQKLCFVIVTGETFIPHLKSPLKSPLTCLSNHLTSKAQFIWQIPKSKFQMKTSIQTCLKSLNLPDLKPEDHSSLLTLILEFLSLFPDHENRYFENFIQHLQRDLTLRAKQSDLEQEGWANLLKIFHKTQELIKNSESKTETSKKLLDQAFKTLKFLKNPSINLTKKSQIANIRNLPKRILIESVLTSLLGNFGDHLRKHPELESRMLTLINQHDIPINHLNFHSASNFPFTKLKPSLKHLSLFAQIQSLRLNDQVVLILQDFEDPLPQTIIEAIENKTRVKWIDEGSPDLQAKIVAALRFEEVLVLRLDSPVIPELLHPLIFREIVDHNGQLAVRVGEEFVTLSAKARIYLRVQHKGLLHKSILSSDMIQNLTVIDCSDYSKEESARDFERLFAKKWDSLSLDKEKSLYQDLLKFSKLKAGAQNNLHELCLQNWKKEEMDVSFYSLLIPKIKDYLEHEQECAKVRALLNDTIKPPRKLALICSRIQSVLSRLADPLKPLQHPLLKFREFLYKLKMDENNENDSSSENPTPPSSSQNNILHSPVISKVLQFFIASVLESSPGIQSIPPLLTIANFLDQFLFHKNSGLLPILRQSPPKQDSSLKLKWALDAISSLSPNVKEFCQYLSVDSSLANHISGERALNYLTILKDKFLQSFAHSSKSSKKESHLDQSSKRPIPDPSQSSDSLQNNFDSILIFLFKHFNPTHFISHSIQYVQLIFTQFKLPEESLQALATHSLHRSISHIQTALQVSSTQFIFLLNQGSSAPLIASTFAKKNGRKIEEYRPFKKPGLISIDLNNNVLTLQSQEAKTLSKVFIQQANNFIHQTTNEGRLLFIDLENSPIPKTKSFLNFLMASCSDCSVPIICSISSAQLLPLPLRLSTFSLSLEHPHSLQPLLESFFSLHIFADDSFFNLPDLPTNQTLRLTIFFSLFAYSVISLRLRVTNKLASQPQTNLNLSEVFELLQSIKDLCQTDFQQDTLMITLRNCSVSELIGSQQFEEITSHVFNESYKSFLKRVNNTNMSVESFPEMDSGEDPTTFSTKLTFRAELWAGVLDSPFHFFLFSSTDEAIKLIQDFQIEDSHTMNILGLAEMEFNRLKAIDLENISSLF